MLQKINNKIKKGLPKGKFLEKDYSFLIKLIMDSKEYTIEKQRMLNKLVIMKQQEKEFDKGLCICLGCNNTFTREFLKNQKMCPLETCCGELKDLKIDSRKNIKI